MIAGDKKTKEHASNASHQNEDALNINDEINELLQEQMNAKDNMEESQSEVQEVKMI